MHGSPVRGRWRIVIYGAALVTLGSTIGMACAPRAAGRREPPAPALRRDDHGRVRPGITVLLEDSLGLIRGRRIGLLTNQAGIDADGRSDVDLLRDPAATEAGVRLVSLFAPEHGIRGTEDREFISNGVDAATGLPVYSLYGAGTVAPPDSLLRDIDALLFDLPEIGTRTWTFVGNLVYALRAAKRTGVTLIVLDRPAPLTGSHRDGPMLDSALANSEESRPGRPARAYALYPFPLRHGMTMGEMALFYNRELGLDAPLRVVPVTGWRRTQWWDETGLPWVRPSPNLPTLTSALVYPSLVAFEGSNLSVGRGTDAPFEQFGAPWLPASRVARALNDRELGGVHFEAVTFTPHAPGDHKYGGARVPGVRVVVRSREQVQSGRIGAAILSVVHELAGDSLRLDTAAFDLRWGSRSIRRALMHGEDAQSAMDQTLPAVAAFEARARRYFLYR